MNLNLLSVAPALETSLTSSCQGDATFESAAEELWSKAGDPKEEFGIVAMFPFKG